MALFLMYHTFAFITLFTYGMYHLILSTLSHFKSPSAHLPRPYHPLPLPPHHPALLRHLPLLLLVFSLLASLSLHYLPLSLSSPSPLSLSYLHTSLSLLLFALILPLSPLLPLPSDLLFLLSALAFALLSLAPSPSLAPSDLQSLTHPLSSSISLASALLALSLAVFPRLFILELALAASVSLQGLWSLQSGLSLYADAFIPEGCHRLLDMPDASLTRCDLDETRLRAANILDVAFAGHAVLVAALVVAVYVAVAKLSGGEMKGGLGGGGGRRHNGGSYEALSTAAGGSTGVLSDMDHVQMKAMGKSSAQA